ncbi:hypothetical protein [Streptomyces sp. NPDC026659]|uniref:hypothetical protein n=1 Tax=Streptomyces sp. NPDC026659 TaxID=3155123 RepID=UPI0033C2AFC9
MPTGASRSRRLLRRILPTARTRTCCWYHGGNWHAVTRLAVTALDRARREVVPHDELADLVDRYAQAEGTSEWQRQALESLFRPAVAVQPDGEGGYINGQHRVQALMDAGVRRTVVLVYRWPTVSP